MDFLYVLIFIVVGIFSMAQKLQEARQKGQARRSQTNRSKPGEVSEEVRRRMLDGADVQVAKAKGMAQRAVASPEATGKELIEALFGEGAADDDDGWEDVHPEARPVPQRKQQQVPKHQEPAHARAAALRQREDMEHNRSRAHRRHGAHKANTAARAKAEEERKRQQVLQERERRKQAVEAKRREASRARHQKRARSAARGIIAPAANSGEFIPQNLTEVRRAIVMSEILGKPKAFQ